MSSHQFKRIQSIFSKCLRDTELFDRGDRDSDLFESDTIKKDNAYWLSIAAGITKPTARDIFPSNPKRAEKAIIPIRFKQTCEISLFFVVRPFEGNLSNITPLSLITPFAFESGIPWLEIRNASIRVSNLPQNNKKIDNIRWEWDAEMAKNKPHEPWLRVWHAECGFNPAHPPSHLHLNSNVSSFDDSTTIRNGDLADDFRLSIGNPNPLALILSLASWLRTM